MYKIYKIVDNTNNNVYIGQTKNDIKIRIQGHIQDLKRNNGCSSEIILINNDWYYEVIEETDDIKREIYWIQNTENCINKNKYDFDKKEYDKQWAKSEKRREWERNYDKTNIKRNKYKKEYAKVYNKEYKKYKNSWGGDPRSNNNLLLIDAEAVFN